MHEHRTNRSHQMKISSPRVVGFRKASHWMDCCLGLILAGVAFIPGAVAQTVIYQEGFNTDGEAATPQRYTTTGRFKSEYPHDPAVVMPSTSDQAGPVFWGYKSEVSIVGVFGPTPERRALLAWDGAILAEEVTPQFWTMFDATINWLVRGKTNATIVFSQDETGGQSLADHLRTKGYTITTDPDQSIPDTNIVGDLIIKTPTGTGGRFARVAKPVLTYWADSHDDLLVSTIGTTAMFESTNTTIVATNHPAAGGLTGSFIAVSNTHNWQLIGDLLPQGAITVATFVQPGDPTNRIRPLLVLLNGPNDTPAGSVYGGGEFSGFEGTNFFGGAALNKYDVDGTGVPKTLTLRPI